MTSIEEETSGELNDFENTADSKIFQSLRAINERKSKRTLKNNNSNSNDRDKTGKKSSFTGNNIGDGNRDREPNGDVIDIGNPGSLINEPSNREKRIQGFQEFRNKCGLWVNNDRVQLTMVVFIFINAAMMGIATSKVVKNDAIMASNFDITDNVFLVIFTIELGMQFMYHGFALFLDGWLLFDFIIIGTSWWLKEYQIVRAFRVFRAFRLVTRVKIMKDLILALLSVMPRMAAIFLMLLLIFYIFAVMFTQLFECDPIDGKDPCGDMRVELDSYFGSLENSFLTLFQIMTMDEWSNIVWAYMKVFPFYAWFFIIVFMIICGFIVFNLIVAVICDAIGALDEKEKAKLHGHGYNDGGSEGGGFQMELRDQLDNIEDQVGDLTRIQARTFHTLQYLTQQLQVQKEKTHAAAKPTLTSSEENDRENSERQEKRLSIEKRQEKRLSNEDKKDQRPGIKKQRSGERSRRKVFAQAGYVDKRKTYTDTWTQDGSDRTLRKAMVTNFAKSARELQKMREKEGSDL